MIRVPLMRATEGARKGAAASYSAAKTRQEHPENGSACSVVRGLNEAAREADAYGGRERWGSGLSW